VIWPSGDGYRGESGRPELLRADSGARDGFSAGHAGGLRRVAVQFAVADYAQAVAFPVGHFVSPARCCFVAAKNRSCVWLESLSQKFKEDITNERGYDGNSKVGGGKDVFDCRGYTSLLSYAGALEFSHQEIGIKEEDNETHLDHRSPDVFLHREPLKSPDATCLPASLDVRPF
jgi:hypothetical protein